MPRGAGTCGTVGQPAQFRASAKASAAIAAAVEMAVRMKRKASDIA
jgi:hypothetical protein